MAWEDFCGIFLKARFLSYGKYKNKKLNSVYQYWDTNDFLEVKKSIFLYS